MSPAAIGLLQAASEGPGGIFSSFLIPMAMIFFIFYFLLIRPQQKQQKQTEDMRKTLEKGDRIVTAGGLHGRVTGLTDDVITMEIADKVKVKISRDRIDGVEKAKKGES